MTHEAYSQPESISRQIEHSIPSQVQAALREYDGEVAHGLTLVRHESPDSFSLDTEAILCKIKTAAAAHIFERAERSSVTVGNRTVTRVGSFKNSPLFLKTDTDGNFGVIGMSVGIPTPDEIVRFSEAQAQEQANREADIAAKKDLGFLGRALFWKK